MRAAPSFVATSSCSLRAGENCHLGLRLEHRASKGKRVLLAKSASNGETAGHRVAEFIYLYINESVNIDLDVKKNTVLFDCASRVHSRRATNYDGLAFDGSWSWKTRA